MSLPDRFANLSPLKRALLAIEELQARLDTAEHAAREPVAVIGMGCRIPGGADSPDAFWRLLHDGVSAIRDVPAGRWTGGDTAEDGATVRRGGFLDDVDRFDAAFFGIAPREAVSMDPQQRLLLEVVWEALEHAGQAPDRLSGSRTGVFVGICSSDYADLLKTRDPAERTGHDASGVAHSIASGRLSYLLGLQGPSMSIDTACSSSLLALHLAAQSLRLRESHLAIAAGVGLLLTPDANRIFAKAGMLASDGRCKTFDARADGYVRSEGCAVVVLKRLADAVADDDRILGVVRGSAVNQDGPSSGLTAPNGPAQEAVIREALANAGVSALDVSYVEAHGTGTALGDPIEIQALAAALGSGRDPRVPLLVGSVKTNVGHMEAAAGLGGLIKVLLALAHRQIPAHLNFSTPNPLIDWEALPITVPTRLQPWEPGGPRIAGVSSFGFSGTNVHVVVEEAPAPVDEAATVERPAQVLAVSARTPASLDRRLRDLGDRLASAADGDLADICYTANAGRAHHPQRAAVVTRSAAQLRGQVADLLAGRQPAGAWRGTVRAGERPRVAFLFTGQGAQHAGMGTALYATQPAYRAALDRCADALHPHLAEDIRAVIAGEASRLDRTAWTQPALFAVEYALAAMWRSWGVEPAAVLGHSIGEYVAAVVAGVLTLEDAARLVAVRGRLMDALPAGGAMAAVFADEAGVRAAVSGGASALDVAAVNAPSNVVISGPAAAVDAAVERFTAAGVKTQRLVVSHAFHSSLIEPMLDEFEREAAGIAHARPQLPVMSNVTGQSLAADEWGAAYWRRHARSPVRFAQGATALFERGIRVFIECGPHPTLIGLAMQSVGDPDVRWLPSLRRGRDEWDQVAASLAELYAAGGQIDWVGFDRGCRRRKVSLPTYPFERERYWVEATRATAAPPAASARPAGGHPLLGDRLSSPALAATVFEAVIDRTRAADIYDHRVLDRPIMPGAGFIEMGLAAAGRIYGPGRHALTDLFLHDMLVLPADGRVRTQVVVRQESPDTARLEIYGLADDPSVDQSSWTLHASGRLERAGADAEPDDLEAVRARCPIDVPTPEFYDRMSARGLAFGPAFRALREIRRGKHDALGRAELDPEAAAATPASVVLPAALLDACIQVAAVLAEDHRAPDAVYLPFSVERCTLDPGHRGPVWAHADLQQVDADAGMLTAAIRILASDGRSIGAIAGLRFRRADQSVVRRLAADPVSDWMYEVQWEPVPTPSGPASARGALAAIGDELAPRLSALAGQPDLRAYREVLPRLEAVSLGYVVRAVEALGLQLVPGRRFASDTGEQIGVVADRRRLFERLLGILEEERILDRRTDGWEVVGRPDAAAWKAARSHLLELGAGLDELTLLDRCGAPLADVLTGRCDALTLLFPDGSQTLVERIYRDSALARAYHDLFREAVRLAIGGMPADRPLRVLEVGAGTGSTTASLLPDLPAGRAEYIFTDISPLFVARARQTLAAWDNVRYQALDIERDPEAQGVAPASVDVVIAADVVHATRDLHETLGHVRRVLRPGGLLAMLEVTARQRWVELTFGLTDGWWRFADLALRPASPLLDRRQWASLLSSAGFGEVAAISGDVPDDVLSMTSILLARRPLAESGTSGAARRWLVLADTAGIGARLAARLRAAGEAVEAVESSDDDGVAGLAAVFGAPGPLAGVVDCRGLDLRDGAPAAGARSREAQARACRGLLRLVQDLAARALAPRLWIVTAGAQPVGGATDVSNAAQATLWGLGNVIALEHPDLRSVRLDLDPAADAEVAAQALVREVLHGDAEDRVGYRRGQRFVARLDRAASRAVVRPAPYRLTVRERGSFDQLEVVPFAPPAPGAGEVEIHATATGLNFRDVLNALGRYPEALPFGGECAGVVARVGAGVSQVAPGDRVMAVAAGSFASHVIADARFVVPIANRLTDEEAATVPVAYLTAHVALNHLARLRPGQRILIHAAAGGVGLAAVHLARRAGVEVFATAGSADKHAALRALGVRHVMSSRTPAFADEVLAATGGRGVDVVLNSLSGELIDASFRAITRGGTFLEIGKNAIWSAERVAALGQGLTYHVIDWGATAQREPEAVAALFRDVAALVADGTVPPLPHVVFDIDDVSAAFRFMAQARHIGKIVVRHRAGTAPVVRGDATYLVTGGLSGLGLLTAEWLAGNGARHLVLAGRHEPSPAAQKALDLLRGRGVDVRAAVTDVADAAAVSALLESIRRVGPPLRGVVHAAGVLADAILLNQSWDRFAGVFAPKVFGTAVLDELTAGDPLDFFVLYSSTAGVFGSPGQGNHAAASTFEDALASSRQARGRPATSISWGAWASVGAGARHRVGERVAAGGVKEMAPELGLDALERALASRSPHVVVSAMDWPVFASASPLRTAPLFARLVRSRKPAPAAPEAIPLPDVLGALEAAPLSRRAKLLLDHVRAEAGRVMGLPPEGLDARDPLRERGLDSLMAVELRNVLARSLNLTLPATLLFDYPTPETLARHLGSLIFGPAGEPATDSAPVRESAGQVLDAIEDLSDEQVDRLLAERMGKRA
jgi:acyl transferase domain-containing protein/NADPH:quinone reductase-like Zn-dependent oxidoreductase/NAD(P)-dependent dehydrogenase (short-subunit alcohol dehydrogenase family)